jgi:4-hydroxy-tetrahydrodipicolinate synthase
VDLAAVVRPRPTRIPAPLARTLHYNLGMNLTGVFAPVPTPFDQNDEVDAGCLRTALEHWGRTRLSGVVVLGSNGEAVLLDEDESDRTLEVARAAVPRDRTLIVGAGRESTRATIRAVKRAAELGADAVLVRTPSFFKNQMTTAAFVTHYTAVADASPVPVVLYNFTAVTGVNLQPAAVEKLSQHPNIAGIKESGGDIGQIAEFVAGTPSDFRVFAGSSLTFYAALTVGASGGILALGGVLPEACVRLCELVQAGRHDEARQLQHRLVPLARLLSTTYGVPGLKAALHIVGVDVGRPRPPLTPLSDTAVLALKDALAQFEGVPA